jgi:dipeptidyl aminopeptidase/acylaminoacyl peptidase
MDSIAMERDMRDTPLYREAESLLQALRSPGTGQISDAAELNVSPDGKRAVFAATIMDRLAGLPPTRIAEVEFSTGSARVLTFGPNTDRLPRYSPDGRRVAFLSDRRKPGDFQLYLLDTVSGAARPTPSVPGWIEYFHWSPDGRAVLLGVAGYGADVAGAQGAVTSQKAARSAETWMPTVETGNEDYRWRQAWVYELERDSVRQVSIPGQNIWEAVWCGSRSIAAVVSPGPAEGLWYSARLELLHVDSGERVELYVPKDQLGLPAASPSGKQLVVVEAVCSDRGSVSGDLWLIDCESRRRQRVDTNLVDVTHAEWRSEQRVLVAGHRGFQTVLALYDCASNRCTEIWSSQDITTPPRYAFASGWNDVGDCALIGESFVRAPEIAVIRAGQYCRVKSFDLGYAEAADAIGAVEPTTWQAPDGLEIQGWLLQPRNNGPHPLVMNIHGGPVSHWRPTWLARSRVFPVLMLLRHGYAVLFPNPRGSTGRGQEFVRRVLGDMCGADTYDYLSGIDHLVKRSMADGTRLGVTGGSYGGLMTSWLITQDPRFAAAVSLAPVTNHVTEHLISNIPHFVTLFLADSYTNPRGRYFERSPVMHARKVKTPTLNICGALDRCTPPEEAAQFHNALLESGVESALVTYPEEGHGVRKLPAAIDYASRLVDWFERHMPAR